MRSRRFLCVIVAAIVILVALPVASQTTRREMIVTSDWLTSRLDGKVVVIDVADKEEYEQGHIPDARLLEKKKLLVDLAGVPNEVPPVADFETLMTALGIGDEKRVVFYSRDPLLATRAWFTLDSMGHGTRASVLNGGYARWVADGKETTTVVPAFDPAPFHATENQAAITTIKVMRTLIQSRAVLGNSLAVIDARPPASYRGELAGAGVRRPGHIPGAINVYWQENLTGPGN
ncbi:MAG: rhodanese-like domain-containing protein, partial [Acidobacteriota bacterium]